MKLFLVRHGETQANAEGIVQGWLDTELNERGLAQVAETADNFNEVIDSIYSSDLQRATKTAEAFRRHYPDIPYREDARLRERNFGDASGTHRDTFDWEQFWSVDDYSTISNAETLNDFTARVHTFLDDLKTQSFSSVLIVTHGGTINRIQTILDPAHTRYPHKNASILEIDLPVAST